MYQVRTLTRFTMEDELSLGLNGFYTSEIYEVSKEEKSNEILFSLKLKKLNRPLKKEWPHLESDILMYNESIKHGYSLGAYEDEELVGVLIADYKKWNNSFWIDEIVVKEGYRGTGIGSTLVDELIDIAIEKKVRVIGLETQNINLPAISFYRTKGFELDGLDLSLYSNNDLQNDEFAIYMNKKLILEDIVKTNLAKQE